jgi:hypothetical protein
VLVKIAGMGVLIGLGYLARRFVHRRLLPAAASAVPALAVASVTVGPGSASGTVPADADDEPPRLPSMRALRLSVTIEVAVVAAVLAATAILVNTPTGRESYAPPVNASSAFDTGGPGGVGTLRTSVTPARLGPDQVELTLTTPADSPSAPPRSEPACTSRPVTWARFRSPSPGSGPAGTAR